ncbi:MAG: ISKra4 family transposase [Candidatus Thorarchaeota archaeon]
MVEGFQEASKRLKELTGVSVSGKEEQLESEEIGKEVGQQEDAEVEAFWSQEKEISAEVTARRLYITADGVNVRTEKGTTKEMKIGGVYETALAKDAIAGDIRYTGGYYKSEALGKKLYVLALRRGLRTASELVLIGDGSKWIWVIANYHFPDAIQIVDWYHAEERLWSVGRAVYGEGTSAMKKWVKERLKQLIEGKVEAVIDSLSELSSSNADATEQIEDNITYFTNNKERMRYNEYIEKGYHIGSGIVESACKHVVGQRLKQAGMTWSVEGADAIIQLRILWKNGEWNRFWKNRKVAA